MRYSISLLGYPDLDSHFLLRIIWNPQNYCNIFQTIIYRNLFHIHYHLAPIFTSLVLGVEESWFTGGAIRVTAAAAALPPSQTGTPLKYQDIILELYLVSNKEREVEENGCIRGGGLG